MSIKSFKELIAYQKSYELVKLLYIMTKKYPKKEMYGMTSQIRRAAVSIPSNIAEGYMRGSKEYIQFLKIAFGSSAELETLLFLSKDLGLCEESSINKAVNLLQEVMKLLRTYLDKLTRR